MKRSSTQVSKAIMQKIEEESKVEAAKGPEEGGSNGENK
jgi:hypothetical protein